MGRQRSSYSNFKCNFMNTTLVAIAHEFCTNYRLIRYMQFCSHFFSRRISHANRRQLFLWSINVRKFNANKPALFHSTLAWSSFFGCRCCPFCHSQTMDKCNFVPISIVICCSSKWIQKNTFYHSHWCIQNIATRIAVRCALCLWLALPEAIVLFYSLLNFLFHFFSRYFKY